MTVQTHYKKILILSGVVVFGILAFIYRDLVIALLANLEHEKITNPLWVAGVLILVTSIAAPLGFPGTPLTLITGSIFGVWFGTLVALIGNTIGAICAFLLSRYIFKENAQVLIAKYPRIKKYIAQLEEKGLSTILFLRLVPLFPFNATNFLLGVTPVSLRTYILGSFIGMIPGTFLFVYLGGSLRKLSPLNIAFSVIGIIVLIVIGRIYEKRAQHI